MTGAKKTAPLPYAASPDTTTAAYLVFYSKHSFTLQTSSRLLCVVILLDDTSVNPIGFLQITTLGHFFLQSTEKGRI